jgi:outer membrane protein TolC
MNKIFYTLSVLSLIIISLNTIQAQTTELDDSTLTGSYFNFPPLRAVIDSVIKRSAMLDFRNYHVRVTESTLASERIYWMRHLGIQLDTRYGNLSNFATSEDGLSSTTALTTARQLNYSAGVFLKFPLFDAINRKNQIKLAELEINEAKSLAESTKQEIRQVVIRMYQDLLLKQKILQILSSRLSDGRVNQQMVEKEFRNGVVQISEYARISGMTSAIQVDYEKAMSEFIIAKQLIEDMAGFVFDLTHSNYKR